MFTKLEDSISTRNKIFGTSFKAYLIDVSYEDLVRTFGEPTFPEASGDNKIQKEWVFESKSGNIFTVYDWKSYSEQDTINKVTVWHIGGKKFAGDFSDWAEREIIEIRKTFFDSVFENSTPNQNLVEAAERYKSNQLK